MTKQAKDKILLSRLGFYLDGWADMIEGMGEKAVDVRKDLITELENRNMPEVEIKEVHAQPVWLSSDTRLYNITTTSPGATATIYVSQHGHDLFTSWRVFLKPTLNKDLLIKLLKASGIVGALYYCWHIVVGFIRGISNGFFKSEAAEKFGERYELGMAWWLGISTALVILFLAIHFLVEEYGKDVLKKANKLWVWLIVAFMTTLGRLLYDYIGLLKSNVEIILLKLIWYPILCGIITLVLGMSLMGFLRALILVIPKLEAWEPDWKLSEDIFVPIGLVVFVVVPFILANPLIMWKHIFEMARIFWDYFSFGFVYYMGAFTWALYALGVGFGLLVLGGLFLHKSLIYFFIIQPNYFDADDITAMTISVHNSLLRVLDNQGIDVSKLRLKQKFTGGRRGEDI